MVGRLSIAVYFHLTWTISFVRGTSTVPGASTPASTSIATTTTGPLPPGPLYVSVEPVSPLSLNVSWTMPVGHNSTSYNVSLNATYLGTTNATIYVIDSNVLKHGKFYAVGVMACENNRCSNEITNTSATYPDSPRNPEVIFRGVNDLSLQWQQQGGSSSIEVMVDYHNHKNVTVSTSTSDNVNDSIVCNITNLPTAGGQYTIHITAVFMDLRSSNETDVYTFPEKPGNISLVNQTTSEICLNWTQSGNAFSFNVSANSADSPAFAPIKTIVPPSNNASSSECLGCRWPVDMCISLRTAGELYEISVSAEAGNLFSARQTTSQATAPFAPSDVRCSGHHNSSLTIQVEPPAEGKYDAFVFTYNSAVTIFPDDGSGKTSENETVVMNLTAGVMYVFEVKAQSHSVSGGSRNTNCTTVPNAPKEFSSSALNASSIRLDWRSPEGYALEYEIIYTNGSSDFTLSTSTPSSPLVSQSLVLQSLSSDCQYNFTISTRNFNFSSANETSSSFTLPDPVSNLDVPDYKERQACVSWKPPERHANVDLYELLLNNSGSCLRRIYLECSDKQNTVGLYPSSTDDCSTSNESIKCNEAEIKYQVNELNHSTAYSISVAALNPGGKGSAVETEFATLKHESLEWIIGVVMGCVFGVLLVVLGFLLFQRWRNNKSPFKLKKSESSKSFHDGQENPTYEDEPEPVLIQDFADHVNKMNQDSNYQFACEYLLLGKISAKNPTIVAELPENRTKNRYTDVLPFDDSRVKLIPYGDVGEGGSTDYINASYLPGFNSKREYIAAQGPMRSTIDDFWLMIWQQKVSTIVMVTNLCERGREKCEQYWPNINEPNELICFGDISVELKSETPLDFYTLRIMEVSFNAEKRKLSQYHFLTWPDFGVPEEIEHILSFVTEVREHFQGIAPMLVHCSAGVGRTGTFIVVDHLLQLIKRDPSIDLFHLVLDLRQHRPKMIQAESQYIFAHECIQMAINKRYHLRNSMSMTENSPENGNCLYVNASEIVIDDPPLYANSSEIHEQPV